MGILDFFRNEKINYEIEKEYQVLIDCLRECINDNNKSWVLFEYGTFVILMQPENDIESQAKKLLSEYGKALIHTSSSDFGVITLDDGKGWVVTSHHPDIFTMIIKDKFNQDSDDLAIGLSGRSYRDMDAEKLNAIHIEDKR